MYTPLALLPILLPLLTAATPAPLPQASDNATTTTAPSNTTTTTTTDASPAQISGSPEFMQASNQSITAYTRANCDQNGEGTESTQYGNLLYGKDNHALVVSFKLGRDMAPNEQLDFSFYDGVNGGVGPDGIDKECAHFQYTASPEYDSQTTGAALSGGQCYEPKMPVTCLNIWKTSSSSS